jgi:hypothetical protein
MLFISKAESTVSTIIAISKASGVATESRSNCGKRYYESRCPQAEGKWYSKSLDDFALLSLPQQRKYSHIGRIEETSAGMIATVPCARCIQKNYICKVYTSAAQQAHSSGMKQAGSACSRCRYNGVACSPVGQGRQVSTKASRRDLEKELDIAKAQIAGLKKEIEILREQARSV